MGIVNLDDIILSANISSITIFKRMADVKYGFYHESSGLTNIEMIEACLDEREFNFYFPADGMCVSEYISRFKDIFLACNAACESKVFEISHDIYKAFFCGMRECIKEFIYTYDKEDYEEIKSITNTYLNGDYVVERRKLEFENKLDPVEGGPGLLRIKIVGLFLERLIREIDERIELSEL